jgi:hypothetical protein
MTRGIEIVRSVVNFPSVLLTAVVAGVYSAVVCVLLVFGASHRLAADPQQEPQFLALKKELARQPGNEQLQHELRALDLALRQQYVRRQQFTGVGAYLLLAGIAVTLTTARWAAALRRRLPRPAPPLPGQDADERDSRYGLIAVTVFLLVLVGTAWAMKATHPTQLPRNVDELPAEVERDHVQG